MLKKILMLIVGLLAIYAITCFIGPKRMDCTVQKTIPQPAAAVFEQMSDFRNWPNWSVWIKRDSQINITYGEKTSGLGGKYSWTSPNKNTGNGAMEITEFKPNESAKMVLTFVDWDSKSNVDFTLKSLDAQQTQVSWEMKAQEDVPWFMRGMMLFMGMEGAIKKDFEESLANLETYLKTAPASASSYKVLEGNFKGGAYLSSKRSVLKFDQIGPYFDANMPKLGEMGGANIVGAPCGFYWNWNEEKQETDMAAAMPVSKSMQASGDFSIVNLSPSKEFTVDYYGAYEKTTNAYKALDQALAAKGIPHPEMVVEEYITDPGAEKDTTKWLTRIHFIVK